MEKRAYGVQAAQVAMHQFDLDSLLFPLNSVTYEQADFGPQVMEAAQSQDVARPALDIADAFTPLTAQELEAIRVQAGKDQPLFQLAA